MNIIKNNNAIDMSEVQCNFVCSKQFDLDERINELFPNNNSDQLRSNISQIVTEALEYKRTRINSNLVMLLAFISGIATISLYLLYKDNYFNF